MTPQVLSLMEPVELIEDVPIPDLPPVEEVEEPEVEVLHVIPTVFYVERKRGEIETIKVEDNGD